MRYIESEIVELKEEFTKDIRKGVIAFANTKGGVLYVGIADNGVVKGISAPTDTLLRIISMLRDSIKPDIMSYVSSKIVEVESKNIIVINVARGSNLPYYLGDKGLKPSGVYIRQGSASAPASESAIRNMIKEADGNSFEKGRALETELTFKSAQIEFKNRNIEFSKAQMKTLGLIKDDEIFTNLGLIISDQCKHTIKVAVFHGKNKMKFKDRREFGGSVFDQIKDAYQYIDLLNKTGSEIKGLRRTDVRDYPEEAIREALINTIVHREYSFSGSTLISIYDDRIEFVSIGGLFGGITMKDILLGISQTRNERLAAIFYRLELIEAYGTGIAKILYSYKDNLIKPEVKVSDNAFMITIPRKMDLTMHGEKTDNKKEVLKFIKENKSITRKEVENILGVGQTLAGRLLKELADKKIIMKIGKSSKVRYVKKE
ncbi:putative DNA binding domain-containing protein [Alkaliphilus transvaalensis]|nr:putative DNA binding domain-containing protein [Alkaliphilus transvaalensis]